MFIPARVCKDPRLYCLVIWLSAVALLFFLSCGSAPTPSPGQRGKAPRGGGVNGSVFFRLPAPAEASGAAKRPALVYIPGFTVYLRNVRTGEQSAAEVTDAHGRYMFPRQKPGEYELRWAQQSGWAEGSYPEKLLIEDNTLYPKPVAVSPESGSKVLAGRVRLADGSSPWFYDEFFGINHTAQVDVFDKSGSAVGQTVKTNDAGEFAVAGLPDSDLRVRVTSEAAKTEQAVPASALSGGGPAPLVALTLNNRRPRIRGLVVKQGQEALRAAKAGESVTLVAAVQDPDQDKLKLTSRSPEDEGSLSPSNAPGTWSWKLSQAAGGKTAYVLAEDGRGGYATASVILPAGAEAQPALSTSPTAATAAASPVPTPGAEFLTFKGAGTPDQAAKYYKAVDPHDDRTTLGGWWAKNGFDQNGDASGEVRTSYLNNNDLGFGRDMHILKHPDGTVSAYVTNYGKPDQDPSNADLAAARADATRVATVCMEYSPVEDEDQSRRVVKFFVYAGGSVDSARLGFADLDGGGNKYVPNLCLNCHGGNFRVPPAAALTLGDVDMQSSFREFDLATLKYPGGRDTPNDAEQALFKQQNLIVKGSDTAANDPDNSFGISQPAIKDLINGWYAGGSPVQNKDYTPAGWAGGPQPLYLNVVAKSCRTCHVALDTRDTGISWIAFADFSDPFRRDQIINYTCDKKKMPHAKITFENFWRSDRPTFFGDFQTTGWDKAGPCTP